MRPPAGTRQVCYNKGTMVKFSYKKLVRDNVVDQHIANGTNPLYWHLSDEEHAEHLIKKVLECMQRVKSSAQETIIEDIAEAQQAIEDLRVKLGVSQAAVAEARTIQAARFGGYQKGLYIDHLRLDDGHRLIPHYRQNSEQYPEID